MNTVIVPCALLLFICTALHAAETLPAKSPKRTGVKTVKPLTNSISETALTNSASRMLPKLVDLGAKKCIPCKKLAPILEELEKEYDGILTVEFIDVWLPENKGKAEQYDIDTIPTQIFYDSQGKELWRHVGFISKEAILAQWKKLGYELTPKNRRAEKAPSTAARKP